MTLIEIGIQYGIGGLALALCVLLLFKIHELELKIKKIEEKIENKNVVCDSRTEYFSKIFGRIETLEKKSIADEGVFNVFSAKLDHLSESMDSIRTNLEKITDFFQDKGMK